MPNWLKKLFGRKRKFIGLAEGVTFDLETAFIRVSKDAPTYKAFTEAQRKGDPEAVLAFNWNTEPLSSTASFYLKIGQRLYVCHFVAVDIG